MDWNRSTRKRPADAQQVLVFSGNEFFVATYGAIEKVFYCKNGLKFRAMENIRWAELIPPPEDI